MVCIREVSTFLHIMWRIRKKKRVVGEECGWSGYVAREMYRYRCKLVIQSDVWHEVWRTILPGFIIKECNEKIACICDTCCSTTVQCGHELSILYTKGLSPYSHSSITAIYIQIKWTEELCIDSHLNIDEDYKNEDHDKFNFNYPK